MTEAYTKDMVISIHQAFKKHSFHVSAATISISKSLSVSRDFALLVAVPCIFLLSRVGMASTGNAMDVETPTAEVEAKA